MDSIYGIEIPEKDKRALLEYIFKPDAEGVTKYQKDYAKSLKNLITSAYFTMKGDSFVLMVWLVDDDVSPAYGEANVGEVGPGEVGAGEVGVSYVGGA